EIGDRAKVVALAEEYLRRAEGSPGRASDGPMAFAALRRAGRIPDDEFRQKRDRWAVEMHATAAPGQDWAWLAYYADPAVTPEDAREALAALARLPATPPGIEQTGDRTLIDEGAGRVYLLAGQLDDAIRYLRPAAGSCGVLNQFIYWIHAHEEL